MIGLLASLWALAVIGPNTIVQIPVETWSAGVGAVTPLLTAVLTTLGSNSTVKSVVNLVLALIGGAGAAITQHQGTLTLQQLLFAIATTFVVSAGSYHSFYKPTALADKLNAATPRIVIGPRSAPVDVAPKDNPSAPVVKPKKKGKKK